MDARITRDHPLITQLAELTSIPAERIEQWIFIVQHDQGVAMGYSLCCEQHTREALARLAATPPDVIQPRGYGGSN